MKIGVYILKSKSKNWFYIGMSESPDERLKTHNAGKVRSTKAQSPYELAYLKYFKNRALARDFEKFLKIRSNKEKLLRKLGYLQ